MSRAAVKVRPLAALSDNAEPEVKLEISKSLPVVIVFVLERLLAESIKSRAEDILPALLTVLPFNEISVPVPEVTALPEALMANVPLEPVVKAMVPAVEDKAPLSDTLPEPAV